MTIDLYTKKYLELQSFNSQHQEILKIKEELENDLNKIGEQLKTEARETGDQENDQFSVNVSQRFHKFYNYDKFISSAKDKEINLLKEMDGIKTQTEIDKEVFDKLVGLKLISEETCQKSFEEKELSKSVSIKLKK